MTQIHRFILRILGRDQKGIPTQKREPRKKSYGVLVRARDGMHAPVYYITFSPFAVKR